MINNTDKFFTFFFVLVPVFLITGPAIPDIIISLSGIYFLFSYLTLKDKNNFITDKFFIISVFFWLSIIFISFFAYDKINSFQNTIIFSRFLIIPTIAYYFYFNSERKIKLIVIIIFCCVCFVAIDTLYQFFNYSSKTGFGEDMIGFRSNWYGRLTGPFGDELVPGAYISKFGLLGYLLFFFIRPLKFSYILEITYLSILGFVCFSSGERMAFATYFMALFFLFIFLNNKRLIFLISIIISTCLILISLLFHPSYNDYKIISSSHLHQGLTVEKIFNCNEESKQKCSKIINLQPSFFEVIKNFKSSAYGEIYNVGLNMFKDNLFTGIGIGNFEKACLDIKKYKKLMKNYNCASHPHNTYIQWLSEGGLISFIVFIFLLSSIFYYILNGNNSKSIKLISLACILIIFWPIMSTGSLIKNWNGVLSFYIISLCISINRIKLR